MRLEPQGLRDDAGPWMFFTITHCKLHPSPRDPLAYYVLSFRGVISRPLASSTELKFLSNNRRNVVDCLQPPSRNYPYFETFAPYRDIHN